MTTIRNPIEWGVDQVRHAAQHAESVGHAIGGAQEGSPVVIRKIGFADLGDALSRGLDDFMANRTDVVFLCIIYPLAGLVLGQAVLSQGFLPLLFPLASGFALLGPVAAVGLYEMSRRRERGLTASWADAFAMIGAPAFGAVLLLGLILLVIFLLWLTAAYVIFLATLGPQPPASASAFLRDVLTTEAGWTMIVAGLGAGFLFALLVLAISVLSFPMLLDRDPGLGVAVKTSVRACLVNPGPMAAWGAIVAAGLVIGSIPLFLGLIVVMPVLGHATWHLYRKAVERPAA
jgi:uncharacterized membrane protein